MLLINYEGSLIFTYYILCLHIVISFPISSFSLLLILSNWLKLVCLLTPGINLSGFEEEGN